MTPEARSEKAVTLSSGTTLGPYEMVSPLGIGGMGQVYRARDARLKGDVTLKIVPDVPTANVREA